MCRVMDYVQFSIVPVSLLGSFASPAVILFAVSAPKGVAGVGWGRDPVCQVELQGSGTIAGRPANPAPLEGRE